MHNQFDFEQFPYRFKCLSISQVAYRRDELEWHKLVVFHANFYCYQNSEFFFTDKMQILCYCDCTEGSSLIVGGFKIIIIKEQQWNDKNFLNSFKQK